MDRIANEGHLYDVWKTIAQSLNLRYTVVPLPQWDYGHPYPNDTWSGFVGELA